MFVEDIGISYICNVSDKHRALTEIPFVETKRQKRVCGGGLIV